MSRVVHFEIHASDPQALIPFYTKLFAWKFENWGSMDYWQIDTGSPDQPGINGGLLPRRGPAPSEGDAVGSFVCTVQVDSLDESFAKAQKLGGTIAMPKMPIPGIGWLAYVKDPDGNLLGIMQADSNAK